jgi:16S rRNA (uracil1498-N3)-methyltransferase
MNERIYFEKSLKEENQSIWLNEAESHHLVKVSRAKLNDELLLMNGMGLIAQGLIREISKSGVLLEIKNTEKHPPPPTKIHLGITPLKKRDKLELIIEKATELGIAEISFIDTDHAERARLNMERLEKIMISAAKQSKNPFLPKLNPIRPFQDFVDSESKKESQKLIAWCGCTMSEYIGKKLKRSSDVCLLIGPEGDFSQKEIDYATGRNFDLVSLGTLRYRSETAAIFAISAIQVIKNS